MATKTMQTRLQMKRDLYANWVEKNPQLLEGELAVVIIPAEAGAVVQEPAVMLKVGAKNEAGELYNFNDLPWLSAVSADVYDWAKREHLKVLTGEYIEFESARPGGSGEKVPVLLKAEQGCSATSLPVQVYVPAKSGTLATTDDVAAVREYVGEIPEGYSDQKTIVAYINKKAEETLNAASGGTSESAASVKAALDTHKAEATAELAEKVDKKDGYSLVSDTEIARLANVDNYDDGEVRGLISDNAEAIDAITNGSVYNDFRGIETSINEIDALLCATIDFESETVGLDTEGQRIIPAINEVHGEVDQLHAQVAAINNEETGILAQAKQYADENGAKYGIKYENKKIYLVEDGTDMEIDASEFIKDGMIENVTIGEDNDLVITFNTAAGKEDIRLPLDQLVDIYTGVEGARVKVTVASDKSISAELVAGSISKNYLDEGVQASLAAVDTNARHIEALETRCGIIETKNGEQDNAISALEESVESYRSQSVTLSQNLEALTGRVGAVEAILETSETDYIVFDCGTASKVI